MRNISIGNHVIASTIWELGLISTRMFGIFVKGAFESNSENIQISFYFWHIFSMMSRSTLPGIPAGAKKYECIVILNTRHC